MKYSVTSYRSKIIFYQSYRIDFYFLCFDIIITFRRILFKRGRDRLYLYSNFKLKIIQLPHHVVKLLPVLLLLLLSLLFLFKQVDLLLVTLYLNLHIDFV